MPPPSSLPTHSHTKKRKLAPAPSTSRFGLSLSSPSLSTPSLPEDEDEDEDFDPSRPTITPSASTSNTKSVTSRQRRKPLANTSSAEMNKTNNNSIGKGKTSREALRKANHSLIERRRREKINAALGELREMVPGLGSDQGSKGGEFKLEVLERTVAYMKDLKTRLSDLERSLADGQSPDNNCKRSESDIVKAEGSQAQPHHSASPRRTSNPPSPSPSPDRLPDHLSNSEVVATGTGTGTSDPDETENEVDLPPPFTKTSGSSPPTVPVASVASLLPTASHRQQLRPTSRPLPPAQNPNPIFLPFPAPSPTSPFLNSDSACTSTSTTMTIIQDPSPFLAPLPLNMGLFGGVFNLDPTSPNDTLRRRDSAEKQQSPPHLALSPKQTHKDASAFAEDIDTSGKAMGMEEAEAANLLLAFSSPDTLRPQQVVMFNPGGGISRRKLTLEADDFSLDHHNSGKVMSGNRNTGSGGTVRSRTKVEDVVGKSAKDILCMGDDD